MEKENFAPTINFDQRDRYRLITRSPVSKEPLVASRRSLINLEFAASGVYPRAFSTFLSRTVNGKARFPHLHVPPPIWRERERERERLRARTKIIELARSGGVGKVGCVGGERGEFGGRRLEGEWYPCAKAHWQHPVSSRTSGRTLRSFLSRGEKTLFSFLSPARHIPFDIRFYRRGRIRRRVSQGQCFPNSTTDAPIHRCIEYLTIVIDGATTMHLLFRMKLCYS